MSLSLEKTRRSSILRWAGSKRQVLNRLESYWSSSYGRYVEPFAGSASLFFRLSPPKAILSDLNSELIEFYQVLKTHPVRLFNAVKKIKVNKSNYLRLRKADPRRLNKLNRAVRFIYLNRNCFNGIYRTNKLGKFNVPYAKRRAGAMPDLSDYLICSKKLRSADLKSVDFEKAMRYVGKNDFVYLDPPYAIRSKRVFHEYGPKSFDEGDLKRLGDCLEAIHSRKAFFVLSYIDTAEMRRHFGKWSLARIAVRRNVAGFTGHRRRAYEILATNIEGGAHD